MESKHDRLPNFLQRMKITENIHFILQAKKQKEMKTCILLLQMERERERERVGK